MTYPKALDDQDIEGLRGMRTKTSELVEEDFAEEENTKVENEREWWLARRVIALQTTTASKTWIQQELPISEFFRAMLQYSTYEDYLSSVGNRVRRTRWP